MNNNQNQTPQQMNEFEEFEYLKRQQLQIQLRMEELRPRVIARARVIVAQIMAQSGITPADVLNGPAKRVFAGAGVPKYRDPDSGKTWSGVGPIPSWIKGKNRDDFLIEACLEASMS